MPSILSIIGEAWEFARKQTALVPTAFWFLFLPMLLSAQLVTLEEKHPLFQGDLNEWTIALVLLYLLLGLLMSWGGICILLIGKRLLQAKSGRTRSSFKAVRSQASSFFLPYILTGILRGIFAFLWTLLLIIPGIIYLVRTAFYPVILISEGLAFREALRRSKDVVRGQSWRVFFSLLLLNLLLFFPLEILDGIVGSITRGGPLAIIIIGNTVVSLLTAGVVVIQLLSLTLLYGHFRPTSPASNF